MFSSDVPQIILPCAIPEASEVPIPHSVIHDRTSKGTEMRNHMYVECSNDEAEVEGFGCPTDRIGGARVAPETYGQAFAVILYAAQTGNYCPPVKPA